MQSGSATPRKKVRLLVPVWGEKYVQEFCAVALPSLLDPDNLPQLSSAVELEAVFLTTRDSEHYFRAEPAFVALGAVCPVSFIAIDDLIGASKYYGITLTLAYARGIRAAGPEQTRTHFVFLNSDFVLSAGALKGLLKRIEEGHSGILASSLRASSELLYPQLLERVDPATHQLSIPPREMVGMALRHLHPTVIAKTITNDFVSFLIPNQIYWQVDGNTLLGRCHLVFMLAIRPEVELGPVNTYCDYGFIPELVPSGDCVAIEDSDEFFLLELQGKDRELDYLRCGTVEPPEIAQQLSEWTTREHRKFSHIDFVFHAGELPKNLAAMRRRAAEFIEEIDQHLSPEPVPHAGHRYWAYSVPMWLEHFDAEARRSILEGGELDRASIIEPAAPAPGDTPSAAAEAAPTRKSRIERMLDLFYGIKPRVRVWHPSWLDYRLLLDWMRGREASPQDPTLIVCPRGSWLDWEFSRYPGYEIRHAEDLLTADPFDVPGMGQTHGARYRTAVVHAPRAKVRGTRDVVERIEPMLEPGGTLAVYVDHENGELDPSNFTTELAQYVYDILPSNWVSLRISAAFVGGGARRAHHQWQRRVFSILREHRRHRMLVIPAAFFALSLIGIRTAIQNLRFGRPGNVCPQFCSSALLTFEGFSAGRSAQEGSERESAPEHRGATAILQPTGA